MASTMSQTTELVLNVPYHKLKTKHWVCNCKPTPRQTGFTTTRSNKLNEVKDKTLIGQGNGFTISKGTVDSATFGRNGVLTAYGEVDSSGKIINLTGRDAAAVSARIGMGIGFIPAGKI
jgi:hypothetical protein